MATEYRIPITIELQEQKQSDPNQANAEIAKQAVSNANNTNKNADAMKVIGAGKLIGNIKRITSITGLNQNSTVSKGLDFIDVGVKVMGMVATGNYGMAVMILTSEVAKVVDEIGQAVTTNNNAQVNKIRLGQTLLGSSNVNATKNMFGQIKYDAN